MVSVTTVRCEVVRVARILGREVQAHSLFVMVVPPVPVALPFLPRFEELSKEESLQQAEPQSRQEGGEEIGESRPGAQPQQSSQTSCSSTSSSPSADSASSNASTSIDASHDGASGGLQQRHQVLAQQRQATPRAGHHR